MAHEIRLEVYTLQLRQKNKKEFQSFYKSFAVKNNIDKFVKDFIKFKDTLSVDESKQKSMQFQSKTLTKNSAKGIYSGIIESGDYGTESTLVNRKTKKVVFTKKKDDLDIKPFYYLIWLPKDKNIAFIMLQRTGIYGINSIFTNTFREFVESKIDQMIVDFSPFVSKQLAKKYLRNGALKEISLKRYDLPPDVIDQLGLKEYAEEILSVEIKIKAKKKGFSFNDKINTFIDDKNGKFFTIDSLKNIGIDGQHEEKVTVKLGNSSRVIDLSDTLEIRPYFDIDNEVIKDTTTGHPTFKSIDGIAKQYINDIENEIF
jgi:hypothetical protein